MSLIAGQRLCGQSLARQERQSFSQSVSIADWLVLIF